MGHERDGGRAIWRAQRRHMERALAERLRHSRQGRVVNFPLHAVAEAATMVLAGLGLAGMVARRAGRFTVERHDLVFSDLPSEFDGYTILHLSDLHVGAVPGLMRAAGCRLAGERADLVVLTGDYQTYGRPAPPQIAVELAQLLEPLTPRDGAVAVLGNHDSHAVAEVLEGLGVRVLINEAMAVERGGARLHLVGTDDIHAFYTPAASRAVAQVPEGFSIVLAHTPELADEAVAAGHRLYLCGHTHGGQICLPGGRPVITALDTHHAYASGRWRCGTMEGYTSRGLGSARPPLRVNCRAEAALIRLGRCGAIPR